MINLNKESNVAYYIQLKNQIKELIISGILKPDIKLPPSRQLANKLKINRNTVQTAYEELEADGLVYSHVGRGTFVSDINEYFDTRNKSTKKKFNWSNFVSTALNIQELLSLVQLYKMSTSNIKISFGAAFPDDDLYPADLIKRCFNSVLKERKNEVFRYSPIEGYPPLREYISMKMKDIGVEATAEDIFISSGTQQALEITSRIFIESGDYIVTEEPTYPGALNVFNILRAKIIGIPLERDGLNIEILEDILNKYNPKFIYTMPNFQNPSGITMSLNKRKELMLLAEKYDVPIIEDDVFGNLRFEGDELPPLKALDRNGQVIYISSLSKGLMPGFRVGWAVLNESIEDRFMVVKQVEDLATNTISQAILYKFISRGYLKTHYKKIKNIYKKRRNVMMTCIKKYFPSNIEVIKPKGGLCLWVKFPERVDLTPVYEESIRRGIVFSLGTLFYNSTNGKNEMRLCYTTNPPEKIMEGIKILGKIISTTLRRRKEKTKNAKGIPIL